MIIEVRHKNASRFVELILYDENNVDIAELQFGVMSGLIMDFTKDAMHDEELEMTCKAGHILVSKKAYKWLVNRFEVLQTSIDNVKALQGCVVA